jgi:hypothetical protein
MVAFPNGEVEIFQGPNEVRVLDNPPDDFGESLGVMERDGMTTVVVSGFYFFGLDIDFGNAIWPGETATPIKENLGTGSAMDLYNDPDWPRGAAIVANPAAGVVYFLRIPETFDAL